MKRHTAQVGMALLVGAMAIGSSLCAESTKPQTQPTTSDLTKKASSVAGRAKQTSTTAVTSVAPAAGQQVTPTATPTTTAAPAKTQPSEVAAPMAGEQIKWQVIAGGGAPGTSTNYNVNGTLGQTAAGPGSSANFKINQGFWQTFSSSCCVGKRGNVNCTGVIDLGDLSALVSYLTGGGFVLCCYDAANVNGVGVVDLGDLSALVSYLTGGGFVLVNCP